MKQRQSQLGFERLDLLRQRRLRDAEALSRAGEMQFLRGGNEIAKMAQLHRRYP
ncbi:MAG TPA: hypothetical protein VNY08_10330 [Bradyrhizobium sp.]|jgi:hypothetical protein|nr:hypothetical protein [Bradyrhizobium sp.]